MLTKLSPVVRSKREILDPEIVDCAYQQILSKHSDTLRSLQLGSIVVGDIEKCQIESSLQN